MIEVTSWFEVPWGAEVKAKIWSLSNSVPKDMQWRVSGTVTCLCPTWDMVKDFKAHRITEAEYTAMYRKLMVERWPEVKRWLDSLDSKDVYLCCWERTGFCHRHLVVKLIRKFRPELVVNVSVPGNEDSEDLSAYDWYETEGELLAEEAHRRLWPDSNG